MNNNLPKVAYFCMEYAVDTSMRTYAGGLGILAGDYIKGAKDYNYPMVGIGLKWKQGYSDQYIDKDDKAYDSYKNYKYDFLKDTGVKVNVKIRQRNVVCKVWLLDKFGTAPLYLLDTDLPENEDTWITGQLYGWFGEERIAQEMVLGIGGIRALRALGIDVDVYHFNEGHALFAGFELIKEKMDSGLSFDAAVEKSKNEIVFTTHTPIVQGNESHTIDRLMYMGANNGLTIEQLVSLGGSPFNMTVGALRLSKISNAVAQLHKETANKMWKDVDGRSEIIGITNAIHLPTWVDENMISAAKNDDKEALWNEHMKNKEALIDFVYERNGVKLDKDALLIGFSRRAAPYKRSDLLFTNSDIVDPLLKEGKIQIVFSGKAHPLDDVGKEIVENLVKFSKKYPNSVVFLQNYDMTIGRMLTHGSDIWLNNPRRPLEASGTSGMKAAMNGVLNVSILDGWWPEACKDGINGWQFGDGVESEDIKFIDEHDSKALYDVLTNKVIPTFYSDRNKWIEMMKNSILSTKDYFSVKRMLDEYYSKMYEK
ncbi:alpha-glucan family phosphorylase [Clostridium guangxiense]|uniref:alpha-glucan family phosphorylase n=2 Tax=Clostridium TaxID=1485 RepID=UPI001E3B4737|nr:alpha-glucan family phosphorylase [Clostridium guangxiense]MCD2347315.1 alpha-glucan family phosphorylase [Clostridium guangxiense]